MYSVLQETQVPWKNNSVKIEVLDKLIDNEGFQWRHPQNGKLLPWTGRSLKIRCEIDRVAPQPDIYWNPTDFTIYSAKLISLLEKFNIKSELFDTAFFDIKTKERLNIDYKVVRLMEVHPAINLEKSDIRGERFKDYRYRHLVVNDEYLKSPKLMFRDANFPNLTLIHEEIKAEMLANGITGCEFKPLYEVYGGFWKPSEISDKTIVTSNQRGPQAVLSSIVERSLSESERKSLTQNQIEGQKLFKVNKPDEQSTVNSIKSLVRELQQKALSKEQYQLTALHLGSLWGEQVQKTYGWQWCYLKFPENDSELLALVSPDRAYCVLPLNFIWQHFEKPEKEETVALLFNMLEKPDTGKKVEPNSYVVLS